MFFGKKAIGKVVEVDNSSIVVEYRDLYGKKYLIQDQGFLKEDTNLGDDIIVRYKPSMPERGIVDYRYNSFFYLMISISLIGVALFCLLCIYLMY
jgi:hypothetical protein